MLRIDHLTILYGKKTLFADISAAPGNAEKIGLVGVNGAGKSTLLKIMAGIMETDPGVVQKGKYTTTGYLPQELTEFPRDHRLYQEAASVFADLWQAQRQLEEVNRGLAAAAPESPGFADLLRQQGELQQLLDDAEIFAIDARIEKTLLGLGFRRQDFDRPCSAFSGGWLMRLMLAKLLLLRPHYLLLDEPTNHLDIETLQWLENFLADYRGSVILISHDRAFLDAVTTTTWELSLGKLTTYRGNYSHYLKEKAQRQEILQAAYDNQQAQIQQTMRFVQRFRAKSTKAKQVQSRLKQLAKMERIELEGSDRSIHFRFPPAAPSGREVLTVAGLRKSFHDLTVFHDINFELQRGDKLAIVGVNGAGKSTLVKILAGLHQPDGGSFRLGHNVTLSYFGQHQAQELDPRLTVLETIAQVPGDRTTTQDRTLLAAFLFQGEDVDKKVQVLSGGEKSRLALAKMMTSPANLLIMDEPTNHLDMASQEILQEALSQYDGTIIIVSHNRYFLDQFTNKVLVIKDGRAAIFHGNLSHYLKRDNQPSQPAVLQKDAPSPAGAGSAGNAGKKQRSRAVKKQQARLRQERAAQLKPHKKVVDRAETVITGLEQQKQHLEQRLADPATYQDSDTFARLSKEYQAVDRRLARQYGKWEEAQAKIEAIEQAFEQQLAGLGR